MQAAFTEFALSSFVFFNWIQYNLLRCMCVSMVVHRALYDAMSKVKLKGALVSAQQSLALLLGKQGIWRAADVVVHLLFSGCIRFDQLTAGCMLRHCQQEVA